MKIAFRKPGIFAEKLGAYGFVSMIAAAAMTLVGPLTAHAVPVHSTSISGFVSTDAGLPVAIGSTIELLPSTGSKLDVLTTAPGVYKADTTGMAPPILIKANDIFGYSLTVSGIANVTPETDAVVNQIYQAGFGTNAATLFGLGSPINLTPVQFQTELSLFKDVFQQPYAFYKIPTTFNPFTTKISYTGGFKNFLSDTTYNGIGTSTQSIASTLGTLDWTAHLHADSTNKWSNAQWWVQVGASGPYSGSYGYTQIPTDPNAGLTYAGINNFYNTTFIPVLKHEGKLLDNFNLLTPKPFYDINFLSGGKDAFTQSEFDANNWRLETFRGVNVGRILSYFPDTPDSSHNLIGVAVDYTINRNGGTFLRRAVENFICGTDGSGCVFYGDQQLGATCTDICAESCSFSSGAPTLRETLRASLTTPEGNFFSVYLSDSDSKYFPDEPMNLTTKTLMITPVHNLPPISYFQDDWSLRTSLTLPFNYNDQFSYFANETYTYNNFVLGLTNEPVNWLSPDPHGTHLLSDFKLGSPLTVKFTPPLTYFPLRLTLDGTACNATQSIDLSSVQKFLNPTATSGSIIVPKQVKGLDTTGFKLRVGYEGLYG
ncbi:MAG: hypothetical protein ABSC63_06710 [Candidatus Binataceae bacterium]